MKKEFRITLNGKTFDVVAEVIGDSRPSGKSGARRAARSAGAASVAPASAPRATPAGADGDLLSPLAGKVVDVHVEVGQKVAEGEKVITLEAMKMNTVVSAPAAGSIKAVHVAAGDGVEEGQPLLAIQ